VPWLDYVAVEFVEMQGDLRFVKSENVAKKRIFKDAGNVKSLKLVLN
jgi:hypothetical protein